MLPAKTEVPPHRKRTKAASSRFIKFDLERWRPKISEVYQSQSIPFFLTVAKVLNLSLVASIN